MKYKVTIHLCDQIFSQTVEALSSEAAEMKVLNTLNDETYRDVSSWGSVLLQEES